MENFKLFFQFNFEIQAFSSKLPSRFRPFPPSYFQVSHISCKILHDQTFSSKIFQDTCKNNTLTSKILEVKSDRFSQKMYGISTGDIPPYLTFFKINGVGATLGKCTKWCLMFSSSEYFLFFFKKKERKSIEDRAHRRGNKEFFNIVSCKSGAELVS